MVRCRLSGFYDKKIPFLVWTKPIKYSNPIFTDVFSLAWRKDDDGILWVTHETSIKTHKKKCAQAFQKDSFII